jgi:prophage regulatory protein
MMQTILRLPAVRERVAMSRSTIYQRINEGTVPPPVNLGKRAVGWLESEIDGWLSAQVERSRGNAA